MAATHHLKVVCPTSEKCAVALPVRKPNAAYRSREHLTEVAQQLRPNTPFGRKPKTGLGAWGRPYYAFRPGLLARQI